MNNEYWNTVNDIGHYGIFNEPDCFYPQPLEHLKADLASGKDFDTGWHGFKKEPQSIRIQAIGKYILLRAFVEIDEIPDLIYDCDGGEDLTDEQIEYVEDTWWNEPFTRTEITLRGELPRDASLQDILDKAQALREECDAVLEESFQFLQGTVHDALEAGL